MTLEILIAALIGYGCGSIPFGLILTKAAGLGDVRNIGSGNIGATNVLRTGNKKLAAATLLLDALKGTLAVLAATYIFSGVEAAPLAAAFGAMAGHIFPIWLKFRGGKGVATFIGVLLGLQWQLALAFIVMWLLIAKLFKISSLSALIAAALVPLVAYLAGFTNMILPSAILAAVIFITHRENIKRLLSGKESKIDLSKKS